MVCVFAGGKDGNLTHLAINNTKPAVALEAEKHLRHANSEWKTIFRRTRCIFYKFNYCGVITWCRVLPRALEGFLVGVGSWSDSRLVIQSGEFRDDCEVRGCCCCWNNIINYYIIVSGVFGTSYFLHILSGFGLATGALLCILKFQKTAYTIRVSLGALCSSESIKRAVKLPFMKLL